MTARALGFGAFLASVVVVAHGAAGYVYVLLYAAAVSAGLPIGFALFGRHHPGGWIAGSLIGYSLTAFALWAPIAAPLPSGLAFVAAWLPGTEGGGIADVLIGDAAGRPRYDFSGRLSFAWPNDRLRAGTQPVAELQESWPAGYGLHYPP